jgi:hypothetical protein
MPELFIQPSQLLFGAIAAGQFVRGIPTPGILAVPPIPPVNGIATCRNLLSDSPPTLLEAYDIYSYSIAAGVGFINGGGFASDPSITLEIALLVNDRVRYIATQTQPGFLAVANTNALAAALFASDLVNPIRLGARDRLSLRLGANCTLASSPGSAIVGAQYDQNGLPAAVESTLSYDTIQLPAGRRL